MAIDWTRGMTQSFELVEIDAATWTEGARVSGLGACEVTRENEGMRVSVALETDHELPEAYYRVYLIAAQDGETERVPLATFLATSCTREFNGRRATWQTEGYSPLYELEADMPPLGWTCSQNVVACAAQVVYGHCRAPLSYGDSGQTQQTWTASDDETWLDVVEALLAMASMHVEVDPWGRVLFAADADAAAIQPAVTFGDECGMRSTLYPDLTVETAREEIPNTVQVVFSTETATYTGTATDDDENSPTSTAARGYTVLYRDTDADLPDTTGQSAVDSYAQELLQSLRAQTVELTYSHGFTPDVGIGTCVGLEYTRAGYSGKGVVTAQSIECVPGCPVEETAECEASA